MPFITIFLIEINHAMFLYFLLNFSIKFLGDAVKVDESLFQNLDDLELSDEDDEDDEDYVPGQSSDSD